ncbi:MAG: RNA methyltransferase [Burkholderiales bacterium]|nr:RNA methyltransferase [Burkholderiales bacterium]
MNEPLSSPCLSAPSPLSRMRVVMVETSHPGNIGSAARAMKTMGLTNLVLVAPKLVNVTTHRDALALASGATDVLANAKVVATFDEAIVDVRLAIAFTARKRELSHPFKPLREAAEIAVAEAAFGDVALVFGNEAMCLSNEEVDRCQLVSAIPANDEYSSLNVSQAIQVAAYEMMMTADAFGIAADTLRPQASIGEIEGFLKHFEATAIANGFLNPDEPKRFMTRMRRLFMRARMEPEEVAILRGWLAALVKRH